MVLVDREIKRLAQQSGLLDSYDENCVTNIGYDLRAKYFIVEETKVDSAYLQPGESAFVASVDVLEVPKNLLCRVELKNSRMRQGFTIDSPVYQPGHKTRIFFRITNISGNELHLSVGEKYAMLVFEQLLCTPEHPYDGVFSDEFDYSGLGQYKDIYQKQIRELEKKTEDLKAVEHSIYANVLVILTVFVALFSFLTTNLSIFSANISLHHFLLYNFVLLGCVSFLVALLSGVVRPRKYEKYDWTKWIPVVLFFAAAGFIFWKFPS